jgi:hypothetical protein
LLLYIINKNKRREKMRNIIIITTESGRKFHRPVENYATENNFSLLRKAGIALPEGERLDTAKCEGLHVAVNFAASIADTIQRRKYVELSSAKGGRTPVAAAAAEAVFSAIEGRGGWDAETSRLVAAELAEYLGEEI